MPQPLAHAFLALSDDDFDVVDQRTLPRVICAALAAVTLAVGAPLGWLVVTPDHHQVPAITSKVLLLDDD
jgi:hypothetical protein